MKKIIAFAAGVILSMMCLTCYAETNGAVKISFGGDVKEAKEVADGKGVSFSLPELADNDFYIYAIELAVFEKQNGETRWHIYTDENGNETKKNILSLRKVLILMSVSEMYPGTGKKQNTRLHIGIMSKAAVTHQNSQ